MKPYLSKKRSIIGNDWFGTIKNYPFHRIRNKLLRKFDKNQKTEIILPTLITRTTLKNEIRKQLREDL